MLLKRPGEEIALVLGLGNDWPEYTGTRHNVGFAVLDVVCRKLSGVHQPPSLLYRWATVIVEAREVKLVWPRTLMNRSGIAAWELLSIDEVAPRNMLVVADDFNLPLGGLRLRSSGSDGGHNGLGSLIESLETEEFPRLRVGIGPVDPDVDPADFVLGKFMENQQRAVDQLIQNAADAVVYSLTHPV